MDEHVINADERIVRVRETVDGESRVFYAIRDVHLGYWRSRSLIHEWDAWTREICRRAQFGSRKEAKAELQSIHAWRREAA